MSKWFSGVLILILGLGMIGTTAAQEQPSLLGVRGILTDNRAVQDDLTFENSMHLYAFDGQANAAITLTMNATSGTLDPFLLLLASDGRVVAWDDDSAGNLNAFINTSLPDDGVYFVLASTLYTLYQPALSEDDLDGRYSLALTGAGLTQDLPVDAATLDLPLLRLDTPTNGLIDEESPVALAALPVQDSVTIDISAGSTDFDPMLYVFDMEGQRVALDDDGLDGWNAVVQGLALDEAGEYLVLVSTFDFHKTGDYGMTGGNFTLTVRRSS